MSTSLDSTLTLPLPYQTTLRSYLPFPTPSLSNFHLTLTYAQSLDAQISLAHNVQTALSGPETKAMTHFLRAHHEAILVGVGTAITDNPGLNCRWMESEDDVVIGGVQKAGRHDRQPIPIILDPRGRMDWGVNGGKVLKLAKEGIGKSPIWCVGEEAYSRLQDVHTNFSEANGRIVSFKETSGAKVNWLEVLRALRTTEHIKSVMVEGGGKVIQDLLREENQDFVQTVILTIAPVWLGKGGVGTCPPRDSGRVVGRLHDIAWIPMGTDVVMAGRFGH